MKTTDNIIYFDNNATTKTDDAVLKEMLPWFSKYYGNASSMHPFGGKSSTAIKKARAQVAALLNCEPEEVFFTSGGTESDNLVIHGTLEQDFTKRHIITTAIEHPAVLDTCKNLEQKGYLVTYVGVDNKGNINLEEYKNAFKPNTALVTTMWANNETGVIFPIHEMAEIADAHNVPFHTDAVQAAGKIPIDLKSSKIDYLSISGHKFHGPKGIGVLYVKKGNKLKPFMIGGHQEHGLRPGTYNTPGIVGIGKAAEIALEQFDKETNYVSMLRDRFQEGLMARIPRIRINGNQKNRLPNTTYIGFEYVEGEAILLRIAEQGIMASSGSACASGSLDPSHVLRAMDVPVAVINGSIRFSLSRFNTLEEVDRAIEIIPPIIATLRNISLFWKPEYNKI